MSFLQRTSAHFYSKKIMITVACAATAAASFWVFADINDRVKIDRTPVDPKIAQQFTGAETFYSNIFEMEKNIPGLHAFELAEKPWSSSFLPAKKGYLADPFADNAPITWVSLPENYKWYKNKRLAEQQKLLKTMSAKEVDDLSPAEKYDLLTGNFGTESALATKLWDMAIETKNDLGMTSWTGMCHGWAPAAVSTARPEKAIQVQSVDYEVDGKKQNFKITFYPDELKGLMTLAFANTWNVWSTDRPEDWNKAQPNLMPMKGGACRLQFPQRAAPSGRIIEDQDSGQKGLRSDNACDDPSPAFWHLTVIHSLKMMNQGLVIDANYNAPVNNHPVYGYEFEYYDPRTGIKASLAHSIVPLSKILRPVQKEFLVDGTTHVVGVRMKIKLTNWKPLGQAAVDLETYDKDMSMTVDYWLELNDQGDIIGGEWRSRFKHPDFVWFARKGAQPVSSWESSDMTTLSPWTSPAQPMPAEWLETVKSSNTVLGTRFGMVVTSPEERAIHCPGLASTEKCEKKFHMPQVVYGLVKQLVDWSRQ
jgi:hypothetical protein